MASSQNAGLNSRVCLSSNEKSLRRAVTRTSGKPAHKLPHMQCIHMPLSRYIMYVCTIHCGQIKNEPSDTTRTNFRLFLPVFKERRIPHLIQNVHSNTFTHTDSICFPIRCTSTTSHRRKKIELL